MKRSFEETGHYPLNFERMIRKCTRQEAISEADLSLMVAELPAAAEQGMREGNYLIRL